MTPSREQIFEYCHREFQKHVHDRTEDDYLQALALSEQDDVLDVGCGGGQTLFAIADRFPFRRLVGVDVDRVSLEFAQSKAVERGLACRFIESQSTALSFEDGAFSVVIASRMLMHAPVAATVVELCRVLTPGGRLLISCTPAEHYVQQLVRRARRGRVDLFSLYALANGTSLRLLGRQWAISGNYGNFQSLPYMKRLLRDQGVSLTRFWRRKRSFERRDLVLLARKSISS